MGAKEREREWEGGMEGSVTILKYRVAVFSYHWILANRGTVEEERRAQHQSCELKY